MRKSEFDIHDIIKLVKSAREEGIAEFFYNSERVKLKFSSYNNGRVKKEVKDEVAIDDETSLKHENIIIKSEYVARIRLNDENGKPFVKVGSCIKKGMKLAEYEYLKINLDILSPCDGVISNILVEDSIIVDYNKNLIIIDVTNK
ncbi:biotin/lipoyl-containing protein [Clostridium sp. C8-1-8]|uniref:biotin/lipoyl-containing protein n=1 Tax=Clostridium sp. C8-1-8 TaxID=2698831 RepID=UPI00136B0CFD|nr:biotin/lipoyl-containing protein [Clostridium sp. C8-1-8]